MGLLRYFLYILFSAFITGELARIQITSFLGITLFEVLIGALVFIYLIDSFLKKKLPIFGELKIPVFFIVTTFLSSLLINILSLSADKLFFSSLYIVRWIVFILLLFYIQKTAIPIKHKIREFMIFAGSTLVILGFLQLLFFNRLVVLFSLGWDEHYLRLFSTFLDPNFAGMFFVLFLLFQLPLLLKALGQKEQKKKIMWISLAAATILSIILTYSRGAYVMLVVGLVVYLLMMNKKKAAFMSAIGIVILIAVFANTKIEGLNPFRVVSTKARIESMQNALTVIKDHPFFGVGFNAYRYAQINYGFRDETTLFPTHADSGTDNSFLFILATSGVLGFTAYLYFLYTQVKVIRKSRSIFGTAYVTSLIVWCIGSLFINGLFYPFLLFWMWSFYAVTVESP